MRADTLAAPVREPLMNRAGELARRWRAEFFDFLVRQFGRWVDVPYVAADYSWDVGAGDRVTYAYCLMGKRLEIALVLSTTTTGLATEYTVAIPANLVSANHMASLVVLNDNGSLVPGKVRVTPGGTTMTITRLDDGAITDLISVEGLIVFRVE